MVKGGSLYKAARGATCMSLLAEIEHQYGIQINKCTKVKDVYRVETKQHGSLCLKSYRVSIEEVQFIAVVQEYLIQNGFLYSPRVFLNRDGLPYIQTHGACYMLTNWVNGQNPRYQNIKQLKKSVRTLAAFHSHAKYISISAPKRRFRVFSLEDRFKSTYSAVKKYDDRDSAKRDAMLHLCKQALEQFEDAHVQKAILHEAKIKAFVHGDYNYPNLVVDAQGNHQLIDFDNTSLHVRMEDLAHIIHRNYPWQADGAFRLIDVYSHVRPIGKDELRLLVALLHEPYPLIRAISQKKQHPGLAIPSVPNRNSLERYSRLLCTEL
jgi:CotS family spore coat protein